MREPQSKQIGQSTYEVMPLGAAKARSLSVKLAHMVGPAMRGGWSFDEAGMLGVVGDILMNAGEPEIEAMVAILADSTMLQTADGKRTPLAKVSDMHFAGALDEQVQWIAFALTVHIGPLVEWLKGRLPSAEKEASKSPSPAASGGPSTG